MRLGDLDALRAEIDEWFRHVSPSRPEATTLDVLLAVEVIIDAAPTVSCEECKYDTPCHGDKCWRCYGSSNFERGTP
jgi:hypothetical protein